jgi:hypothetical protein
VPTPKLADKLIGTSVGGVIEDVTYNFTLQELLQLFIPNIPANTLQGVLDYGNTATQNINLTGTITTTNLSVLATANILNSNLSGNTRVMAGLYDRTNSIGAAGQFLISTGTQVEWYTVPTVIPTLQQVLTSGNTADKNIILTANITAVTATATNVVSNTSLIVNGSLKDGTASAGGSNQILSSTGSGVKWVDMPVYNVISPLLYDTPTKTFSIQVANSSQGGYLSASDWINFDGKQDAILLTTTGTSGASTFIGNTLNIPVYTPDLSGYVPTSRTLTINGVTYDLSTNRSWTIPAGVASVTATTPLSSSGGANPNITIQVANTSQSGYLTNTDWNTFNAKQGALTLTTTGTSGAATLVGNTLNIPQYQSVLTNPITGTGTSGQVAYFNGTSSITSNATFAFTPTSQLLVNNSVTAASLIARGTNLTPTLTAAANNDVLVGLDINPTFSNGAFTGVTNYAIRANGLSYFTGPNYGSFTINAASYPVLTWASNGTNFGYIGSGLITGGAPTDLNIRSTGLLQFAAGATATAALTITSKDAISSPAAITLSRNAGAMFLGKFSSESLGDYCAGPNHVLPTSRTARFSSPLGVYDFQKRSSIIHVSQSGAQTLGVIAAELAYGEGLPAHARSAELRLK